MSKPQAPRFEAYLQRVEGKAILRMSRNVWAGMKPRLGEACEIDVTQSPMAGVARDAVVVAAKAERFSSTGVDVVIYRYDEKDMPKPINVDRYAVLEGLESHPDLHRIIGAASTEDNPNLRAYLRKNVFLVKKDPGPDHHLTTLPAHVIIRSA